MKIHPSILSANFLKLGEEIQMLNESDCDAIHVDIMDGTFVPNISFGMNILKTIRSVSTKPLDVHLMVDKPERYFDEFVECGADIITFHYENCTHVHRNIENLRKLDIKVGIAINPHTPVSVLSEIIDNVDIVCLMSVNPGFGGQKFIDNTYSKIQDINNLYKYLLNKPLIEIDGGVTLQNSKHLYRIGADILVAGNTVFSNENPKDVISKLKNY